MSQRFKLTKELRDSWQCRCLAESKDKLRKVLLAVLYHAVPDAMPVLIYITFGGHFAPARPFLIGPAKIHISGKVACAVVRGASNQPKWEAIYDSQEKLVAEFRGLADRLKLNDRDRIDLMAAVAKWIVADLRIDHMGRKLAS